MSITYILRKNRDVEHGKRAHAQVLAAGGCAMDAALTAIGVTFSRSYEFNRIKLRVEQVIARGATDPRVQCRYSTLIPDLMTCRDIHEVLALLDRWRFEAKMRLSNQWCNRAHYGNRLALATELKIIFRMIRRYRRQYVI